MIFGFARKKNIFSLQHYHPIRHIHCQIHVAASEFLTDFDSWDMLTIIGSRSPTKTMGFLWRNLALAPRHTKEVAYKTLVRPQLEYAAPFWNPHHKLQIQEVEKVQRTAARWTCRRWRNTSSVADMLVLCWTSLSGHPWRPAGAVLLNLLLQDSYFCE